MQVKFIEVTNSFNWGKFLVMRFDGTEFAVESLIEANHSLLRSIGYSPANIWVMDLQTREAACFIPGGLAPADLKKHRIWVCPMFEPFLEWLYRQDCHDIRALPSLIEFTEAETAQHSALWGHRRPGPGPKDSGEAQS